MRAKDVLAVFERLGVMVSGHFAYTSEGRHGSVYVNKDAIYLHTEETSRLCYELAMRAFRMCPDIDCVVGPEKGGIILSQWVGYHLAQKKRRDVLSVFAEKKMRDNVAQVGVPSTDFDFAFARGYGNVVAEKNVLIVEDVMNTGKSVEKLVRCVRKAGGFVEGIGAICNRGSVFSSDIGVAPKLFALLDISLPSWLADECPMCAQGIALNTELGAGKQVA